MQIKKTTNISDEASEPWYLRRYEFHPTPPGMGEGEKGKSSIFPSYYLLFWFLSLFV